MNTPKVTIGLINPKSPTNVGAVLRAAGCFRADAVNYTGKRYNQAKRYHTDTKNRIETIPLTGMDCLLENCPTNTSVVCIELVENAVSLHQFKHPDNAYYIFGPEDGTINQEIIDQADTVVYIPTIGCMNLAATVNVVLYDRLVKSKDLIANNQLITQSKDVNNCIKIRKTTEK